MLKSSGVHDPNQCMSLVGLIGFLLQPFVFCTPQRDTSPWYFWPQKCRMPKGFLLHPRVRTTVPDKDVVHTLLLRAQTELFFSESSGSRSRWLLSIARAISEEVSDGHRDLHNNLGVLPSNTQSPPSKTTQVPRTDLRKKTGHPQTTSSGLLMFLRSSVSV